MSMLYNVNMKYVLVTFGFDIHIFILLIRCTYSRFLHVIFIYQIYSYRNLRYLNIDIMNYITSILI